MLWLFIPASPPSVAKKGFFATDEGNERNQLRTGVRAIELIEGQWRIHKAFPLGLPFPHHGNPRKTKRKQFCLPWHPWRFRGEILPIDCNSLQSSGMK
jgi:hypothetical protein